MPLYSFGKLEWREMSRAETATNDLGVDPGVLFSSLARKWARIVLAALVLSGLAWLVVGTITPLYHAETRLLIETSESAHARPNANNGADGADLGQESIASQMQVIASTDILKQVADKLKLTTKPEFDGAANAGQLGRLLVTVGLENDPRRMPREERVLQAMREKLDVRRVGNSRVIVIAFSSRDPKLAAAIPNAIAEQYVAIQQREKPESGSSAGDTAGQSQSVIADLNEEVKTADAKLADFRAKSGLQGEGTATPPDQQVSDMTAELTRVRAERADSEAKARSVKAALDGHASLDAVSDAMGSGLAPQLRERQIQLRARIADLSTTLLPNHPRMKALEAQLSDLNIQVRNEARKVLEGLQNEAHTAKMREDQLTADLSRAQGANAQTGEQQAKLAALKGEAKAARDRLESYLAGTSNTTSDGAHHDLPVDARIFSRATVPAEPYRPKKILIVGAVFVASMLIMAVVTLLRWLFSGRSMRFAVRARPEPVPQMVMPASRPGAGLFEEAERVPSQENLTTGDELSIRDAAAALVEGEVSSAIFLSPEGDAGAATSILVAREIADAGLRALLLDLTETGAVSHATLESVSYPGITNLLSSEAQFTDVIHTDLYSDCHIMPVGTANPEKAMRAVDRLPIILNSLTTAYDIVIVECGAADPESIRRLVSDDSKVLVSAIEIVDSNVAETTAELEAGDWKDFLLVTPAGYEPSYPPQPGRSAA